jgi:hypothetical protein
MHLRKHLKSARTSQHHDLIFILSNMFFATTTVFCTEATKMKQSLTEKKKKKSTLSLLAAWKERSVSSQSLLRGSTEKMTGLSFWEVKERDPEEMMLDFQR